MLDPDLDGGDSGDGGGGVWHDIKIEPYVPTQQLPAHVGRLL